MKSSIGSINFHLNRLLSKPRKPIKTFFLSNDHKAKRKVFTQFIKNSGIKGKNIFFTDEKRFLLRRSSNHQTCRIRLSKEANIQLKEGNQTIVEMLMEPIKKFEEGFMVAGGISWFGVSKLIFCNGIMNSFSYSQALEFYLADVCRLNETLIFQQDNARPHKSKKNMEFIKEKFNDGFVFNWLLEAQIYHQLSYYGPFLNKNF